MICFGFLISVWEEREVFIPNDFILCSNALHREAWRITSLNFGGNFSAWKVLHYFPSCPCPGNAHTALSLGKRKNGLHMAELFDALLKNAYTVH